MTTEAWLDQLEQHNAEIKKLLEDLIKNSASQQASMDQLQQRIEEKAAGYVAPQILIVLFLIYLFDNIIQLISLRSLWYYGG
jgi:uncharacterized DUF497 family protein